MTSQIRKETVVISGHHAVLWYKTVAKRGGQNVYRLW